MTTTVGGSWLGSSTYEIYVLDLGGCIACMSLIYIRSRADVCAYTYICKCMYGNICARLKELIEMDI